MSITTRARIFGFIAGVLAALVTIFVRHLWISLFWEWNAGIILGAGLIFFVVAPYISVIPYYWTKEQIIKTSMNDLLAGAAGLIMGLIFSALLAIPLESLPDTLGHIMPFVGAVIFSYLGIAITTQRRGDLLQSIQNNFLVRRLREKEEESSERRREKKHKTAGILPSQRLLVDTSAIIDGRIADIIQTGFVQGVLTIPRFVLQELQHIADSSDALRRARGRKGLELLNTLQKKETIQLEIMDIAVDEIAEVDGKLVKLGHIWECPIITTDYNLNRVAEIQGVKVLNVNELANAVKSVVLPGEELVIKVMQEGRETGQGIGYLDDGTMIVVEGGRIFMEATIEVIVSRVLQTAAGKMVFAHPK